MARQKLPNGLRRYAAFQSATITAIAQYFAAKPTWLFCHYGVFRKSRGENVCSSALHIELDDGLQLLAWHSRRIRQLQRKQRGNNQCNKWNPSGNCHSKDRIHHTTSCPCSLLGISIQHVAPSPSWHTADHSEQRLHIVARVQGNIANARSIRANMWLESRI